MSAVPIEGTDGRPPSSGLGAHLRGSKLLMPNKFATALRNNGIGTAEDLISYMISFPSAAGYILQWSAEDVGKATRRLRRQLKGHVPPEILRPPELPRRATGARNPDTLP